MGTHAIVSNYARPDNVLNILQELFKQTAPFAAITVVTNSSEDNYQLTNDQLPAGVNLFDLGKQNYGPICRILPAIVRPEHEYTLFLDDDFLSGPTAHKHLLDTAKHLANNFATLGEIGRNYEVDKNNKYKYVVRDIARSTQPTKVWLTCRAHFVKTIDLQYAVSAYLELTNISMAIDKVDIINSYLRHDDIILCNSINIATNQNCYLTPICEPSSKLILKELPNNNALSSLPGHVETRTQLINAIHFSRQLTISKLYG